MTSRTPFALLAASLVACSSGGSAQEGSDALGDANADETGAGDAVSPGDSSAAGDSTEGDSISSGDTAVDETSSTDSGAASDVIAANDTAGCIPPPRDDASSCNNLAIAGTPVNPQQIASDFTGTWAGGVIADGTYHLAKLTFYTGAGGASGPLNTGSMEVVRFQCNEFDAISEDKVGVPSRFNANVTYLPGNTFSLHAICPSDATQILSYTATSTGFTEGFKDSSGVYRVLEYQKQ